MISVNVSPGAIVGVDDQGGRAVRVNVVGAVLRVVFDDEDGRVLPVGTFRDGFDDATDGVVVLRHVKLLRGDVRG